MSDRKKVENEIKAVDSLGYKARFRENLNLPFETAGGIVFENQAQFNPLKFIDKISKGLNIYENTFIKSLDKNNAFFERN